MAITGEIASLAGAADDPRYFQVLADGHHAAGLLARRARLAAWRQKARRS